MKSAFSMVAFAVMVLASTLSMAEAQTPSLSVTAAAMCLDRASQREVAVIELTFCTARAVESNGVSVEGAFVTDIKTGSVADLAGLKPGDVIYKVSNKPTPTAAVAAEQFQSLSRSADVSVNFLREGHPYLVHLRLPTP